VDLASLVPANREHLQERAASLRASASRTSDKKREHEPPAPRTREQLLARRVWTPEGYEASLRQSRQKGVPVANNDECPIVLRDDTALARQSNEREFKAWLTHLGYPVPELLESPYRLDWLAIRRLRFRMAKMKADGDWDRSRWDPRDSATPRDILEEVVSKVAKGR
jgi:hypothetical protein